MINSQNMNYEINFSQPSSQQPFLEDSKEHEFTINGERERGVSKLFEDYQLNEMSSPNMQSNQNLIEALQKVTKKGSSKDTSLFIKKILLIKTVSTILFGISSKCLNVAFYYFNQVNYVDQSMRQLNFFILVLNPLIYFILWIYTRTEDVDKKYFRSQKEVYHRLRELGHVQGYNDRRFTYRMRADAYWNYFQGFVVLFCNYLIRFLLQIIPSLFYSILCELKLLPFFFKLTSQDIFINEIFLKEYINKQDLIHNNRQNTQINRQIKRENRQKKDQGWGVKVEELHHIDPLPKSSHETLAELTKDQPKGWWNRKADNCYNNVILQQFLVILGAFDTIFYSIPMILIQYINISIEAHSQGKVFSISSLDVLTLVLNALNALMSSLSLAFLLFTVVIKPILDYQKDFRIESQIALEGDDYKTAQISEIKDQQTSKKKKRIFKQAGNLKWVTGDVKMNDLRITNSQQLVQLAQASPNFLNQFKKISVNINSFKDFQNVEFKMFWQAVRLIFVQTSGLNNSNVQSFELYFDQEIADRYNRLFFLFSQNGQKFQKAFESLNISTLQQLSIQIPKCLRNQEIYAISDSLTRLPALKELLIMANKGNTIDDNSVISLGKNIALIQPLQSITLFLQRNEISEKGIFQICEGIQRSCYSLTVLEFSFFKNNFQIEGINIIRNTLVLLQNLKNLSITVGDNFQTGEANRSAQNDYNNLFDFLDNKPFLEKLSLNLPNCSIGPHVIHKICFYLSKMIKLQNLYLGLTNDSETPADNNRTNEECYSILNSVFRSNLPEIQEIVIDDDWETGINNSGKYFELVQGLILKRSLRKLKIHGEIQESNDQQKDLVPLKLQNQPILEVPNFPVHENLQSLILQFLYRELSDIFLHRLTYLLRNAINLKSLSISLYKTKFNENRLREMIEKGVSKQIEKLWLNVNETGISNILLSAVTLKLAEINKIQKFSFYSDGNLHFSKAVLSNFCTSLSLRTKFLKVFNFGIQGNPNFSDEQCSILSRSIEQMIDLEELDIGLSSTGISGQGAILIAHSQLSLKHLKILKLYFNNCSIDDESAISVCQRVAARNSLETIILNIQNMDDRGYFTRRQILKLFENNENYTLTY